MSYATGFYLGHDGEGEYAAFRLVIQKVIIDGEEMSSVQFLDLIGKERKENELRWEEELKRAGEPRKEDEPRKSVWTYNEIFESWENEPSQEEQYLKPEDEKGGKVTTRFQFIFYPDILVAKGEMRLCDSPTVQIRRVAICRWMICLAEVEDERGVTEATIKEEVVLRLFEWKRQALETNRLLGNVSFGSFQNCCI